MTEGRDRSRVPANELTGHCDPDSLPFETTDDLVPLDAIFGQERAVRAIEFALGMNAKGYNLYAAGPDGFGKSTIVRDILERNAATMPPPPDWIYVHNFEDPDRPVGIQLPARKGRLFADTVKRAVSDAATELRNAFESDTYARQRTEIGQSLDQRRNELLEDLSRGAVDLGFQLQMTPGGIVSAPLIDGRAITDEAFQALPQEQREDIQQRASQLEKSVQEAMLRMRGLERDAQEDLERLDRQFATFAIDHLFEPVIEQFGEVEKIATFLEAVKADLHKEREQFRQRPAVPMLPGMAPQQQAGPNLRRYEVNVVVQHDSGRGAPVIVERHPTYYNLIGRVEYVGQMGALVTDHMQIRVGALGRASGGFLILRLRELLANPQSYEGLKRTLSTGMLAIENLGESLGLIPTTALRPEPMPLDVKVVIVGDAGLYGLLFRLDPDFRELFRVKADFEVDFERDSESIRGLAALVRQECEAAGVRCFSKGAVARLVEHSSRMVEDQRRLSASIGAFFDIVRQSDYWAEQEGSPIVEARHVQRALEEREYRSSLVRDRIQQLIDEGTIFIDTQGGEVGQVNALSIYDLGDITFGRPSRITCVVSAGRGAIVNVEREINMSGRIHNKGFLIMRGFLAHRFGQHRAMALHASLTFEQLYGDIDGDSASSTEMYALLSALSDLPIDQGIAVTGSVNQRGEVQPIGGATAKIEGFYDVCVVRGLTGEQGVMIPRSNVHNVVLRPDVAEAVEAGRFHVWAVDTIEEGIEVLTGVPAGDKGDDGTYPEGTVYRLVEDRLAAFYREIARHPGAGGSDRITPMMPQPIPQPVPGVPPEPPPDPPIIVQSRDLPRT